MDEIAVDVDGETHTLSVLEKLTCGRCEETWHLGFERQQQDCPECGQTPAGEPTKVLVEPQSREMDGLSSKEELAQQFEERADYLKRTAKAIQALDDEWEYVGANLLDAGMLRKPPKNGGDSR